jgi:hypothetical protein
MPQKEKVVEEDQDKVKNDLIFLNKLHIHSLFHIKRIERKKVFSLGQVISITKLPTYSLFFFIYNRFFYRT